MSPPSNIPNHIELRYFARYRETLGCAGEQLSLSQPCCIADIIQQLQQRGEPWSSTLSDSKLTLALNQTIATPEQMVKPGDELGFLPPVTGG